jgi:hypothetical protein
MNQTLNQNYLIELEEFPKYFVGVDGIYSEMRGKMKRLKVSIDKQGYYKVGLHKDGKQYDKRVHRLIIEMFIPNPDNLPQVDHINHNKTDNRIENLRWVTKKDNSRNHSMSKRNTSGEQGVCFGKRGNYSYWIAHWIDNQGKKKSKYFPIKKYGDTQAKKLAIEYRKKMVDKYYNRV